ncbi:hypothetical protein [Hyphomonas sp.]|uniref:hypothetical protein n=1 Tax=Hyphomonas sp. TaxID=87 RepID=UPI0025B8B84B|nr:hypothetical protein [Hyphomonas sp.]
MRVWGVLLLAMLAGCVSPDPAVDLSFELKGTVGTVFEIEVDGARCAAGYVNAIQSRTYSNQGELEFWCRESRGAPLSFTSIGKPSPLQFTSSIASLNGRLFEFISRSVYDNGRWRPLTPSELPVPDDALPISIVSAGGKHIVFTIYGGRCEGISVYSESGYHGTYREDDWGQWSAMWTDGRTIAMNVGYNLLSGPLPPPTSNTCAPLRLKTVPTERKNWIYAARSVGGPLLYGGSEASHDSCAPLLITDLDLMTTREITIKDCKPGYVTEVYSLTRWRDEILIGNFPEGALYALTPGSDATRKTAFGAARPDDLLDPQWNGPYRESQAVVVSGGRVFIGMYPWAELFIHEGEAPATVLRLIERPEKTGGEFAPYASHLAAAVTSLQDPYADRAWAQRIPTIVVLSGLVCASTGNRTGEDLDRWQGLVDEGDVRHYGEVFCAPVPGHVMTGPVPDGTLVRFRVDKERLSIVVDGKTVASAAHGLSGSALHRLSRARPRVGTGDYGPFEGILRRLP